MGVSKTENFTALQNETSVIAKALAHPARVAIIEFLLKQQSCIVNDIVDELPLAQPTISQHLKELKAAGLIKGNVEGTSVCYCLDHDNWERVRKIFNSLFNKQIKQQSKCC